MNLVGRFLCRYVGPFCFRALRWTDLENPVSERWYGAHWLPAQTMLEDAGRRNAALQAHLRANERARQKPGPRSRQRR